MGLFIKTKTNSKKAKVVVERADKIADIEFDKEACIGCRACPAVSANWIDDGDKVKPIKTRITTKEIKENNDAEAICPVQAIMVRE